MTEITLEKKYYSGEAVVQMLLENGMGLAGPRLTKALLEKLAALPAADVREIRIGEWEGDGTCPFCQERPLGRYASIRNFCPNCGADLRGGNR